MATATSREPPSARTASDLANNYLHDKDGAIRELSETANGTVSKGYRRLPATNENPERNPGESGFSLPRDPSAIRHEKEQGNSLPEGPRRRA